LEGYPDGTESRYLVRGHTTARKMEGTVVVKVSGESANTSTDNFGGFEVFIPDKGNEEMAILFRHIVPGQPVEWRDMSSSQNRKTILQKVE
jgi:hypothetical protein